MAKFRIGDRVITKSDHEDEWDEGKVIGLRRQGADGTQADLTVAWRSGVTTPAFSGDLRKLTKA